MMDGWIIVAAALLYLSALFLIAWAGDRMARARDAGERRGRPALYALSLAIYCTSWTFLGSVGLASKTGLDFIPIYLGPILLFVLGWPLLIRIVRLAKSQNTTSIADFLAARYGKSQALAAIVTIVLVLGVLPYISLQLKAVSLSLETLIGPRGLGAGAPAGFIMGDIAFSVAMLMAMFAILFGTRHFDATEHQDGLMLAIATESLIKIAAFIAVGVFVTWVMFSGPADIWQKAKASGDWSRALGGGSGVSGWLTTTFLAFCCIILLPRQFHVAVVENNSEVEVRRAAWLFPLYLVLINIFVLPIAIAGLLVFPKGSVDPDTFVLALPLQASSHGIAMLAFIGGLSAATAMVIVESVALSIMVCNGIAVPWMLHRRRGEEDEAEDRNDAAMGPTLIRIRRLVILAVMALAYIFYRTLAHTGGLVSIGLLSFAAVAQLAPAFFGGLVWRQATARGAIAGILVGFAVWAYTLMLPWVIKAGFGPATLLTAGPWSIGWLKPEALFGGTLAPLTQGVLWSMLANVAAYIVVSLLRAPEPIERLQANIFISRDHIPRGALPGFRLWRTTVTIDDLKRTAARYLGAERSERSFKEYAAERNIELVPHAEADIQTLRFTEHLLASAIGAPSSRLVMSLLLRRRSVGDQSARRLLDDASEALQYNRDLLQSAIDQVRQGLAVFDKDMRLVCWNRQFREILELPAEFGRVGAPIDGILKHLAERGDLGPGNAQELVLDRVKKLTITRETYQERRIMGGKRIIEVRTSAMPQGGFVITYSDITERVQAAEELEAANESLERRVRERTAELTKVNQALQEARVKADEANLDKTRFLAAASHDILQPLNAARLYTTTLVEKGVENGEGRLVHNIDASLEAVEEILGALIEISRLDSGRLAPELSVLALDDLFDQMRLEFLPAAQRKGLDLRFVATSLYVRSDRRLLRRLLQNLISNAIKYTSEGRVLVGCRRRAGGIVLQVSDTGPGIPPDKQSLVFKEFERLPETASAVRGLGLGLSIVERIGRVLDHPVTLASRPGRGSTFFLALPPAKPAAPKRAAAPAAQPAAADLRLARLTALCVDNEPAILDGMRALLSSWGLSVLTAASLEEALAVAGRGAAPDVVLADYHLDAGTGLEAIAGLRRRFGSDLPAVVITADPSHEIQAEVRRRGLALLRKPVKAAPLRAVLAQASLRRVAAE
jgi:Na+/proline symporter/CheY-like chemotaxis protein/anti-sigma regulatory factor (Ser/Thr protein kinase)